MGPKFDVYYLCPLCTEASLLRDPNVTTRPYWSSGRPCPPGFLSIPNLAKHLRSAHTCRPVPSAQPPSPQLALPAPASAANAAGSADAAPAAADAAAGVEAAAPAAAAFVGSHGEGGEVAPPAASAVSPSASSSSAAAASAAMPRLSARQLCMLQKKEEQLGTEEAYFGGAAWGEPGLGDGLVDVTVQRVTRLDAGGKYLVEWEEDTVDEQWSKAKIDALRRTFPYLPGLDDEAHGVAPAEDVAAGDGVAEGQARQGAAAPAAEAV